VTLALALAAAHTACADAQDDEVHFGGGPTVYRNYDLRPLTDDGLIAAAIVGLSTVETLRVTDDLPVATPVVAPDAEPACDRMPVAVVPGDYDGDGVSDLWAHEACGGNWISTGPAYPSGLASAGLVPTDPGPYEFVDYFDTPEGAIVLGGVTHAAYMLRRTGSMWSEAAWLSIPAFVGVRVANLWAPMNLSGMVPEFLFQGHETLYVVTALASELVIARTLTQVLEAPFVQPFAAFDHLVALDSTACPGVALGIGVFQAEAGDIPRRIQMVRLDDITYRVSEPPMGLDSVITFSVVRTDDGTLLVGALGRRDDQHIFALGALEQCEELAILAELEIEFHPKTPPLPKGYDRSSILLTDAVRFVPFATAGRATFAHYDGYDLRVVEAQQTGFGWQLEERHHEIHSQRNDSSFDERVTDDTSGL
jgi:hypothetical protein